MAGAHGSHVDPHNKQIALLISILALVLAFSETLGKSAQTEALTYNIQASNLWAFFQAKTIRQTTMRTAAEQLGAVADSDKARKQIEAWLKTAARYEDEPETREGRNQLRDRAKNAERKRNKAFAAYHHFEVSSAAVQIAIVLASASIIAEIAALVWVAGGLGVLGVLFCVVGFFWPTAVHLF